MSMAPETPLPPAEEARALRPLPQLIFGSRWLQLPLYVGLIIARCGISRCTRSISASSRSCWQCSA
jgi:hypothetical protein